jgi:hypothetical protein
LLAHLQLPGQQWKEDVNPFFSNAGGAFSVVLLAVILIVMLYSAQCALKVLCPPLALRVSRFHATATTTL